MKWFYFYLLMIILSVACSEIENATDDITNYEEIFSVSLSLPPLDFNEEADTKVTISRDDEGTHYLWASTDTIGIFPENGCQLYFSLADGVGSETVSFNGGGWGLKKDSDYYSCFPFIPDYYIDKETIPLTFLGQKQVGNASKTKGNIGNYCYMAAKGELSADTKGLSFNYIRLGLLNRIVIPVPAGTYESLTLNTSDNILAYEGTFNCINIDQKINNAKYTDKLTIKLEDVSFPSYSELIVYMMTPPFQNLGRQITFEVKNKDGSILSASTIGKNYTPGAAAQIPNISIYPSSVEISNSANNIELNILSGSGTNYTITTDVSWLLLDSNPITGSNIITVTAEENTNSKRVGHVIVSEKVTYKNVEYTLNNVMTITQSDKETNNDTSSNESLEKYEGKWN